MNETDAVEDEYEYNADTIVTGHAHSLRIPGRAAQPDARNYAMHAEINLADHDRAMPLRYKNYRGMCNINRFSFEPRAPIACACWNALRMHDVLEPPTIAQIHRMSRAQYMLLGGDPLVGSGSVLSGARALREFGVIERYVWGTTVNDLMVWLLLDRGPIVFGTKVYGEMLQGHRRRGRVSGPEVDNTAFVIHGVDKDRGEFRLTTPWGSLTSLRVPISDIEFLLSKSDAEAVAFTGVKK